jgi:hypothetical protein
MGLFPATGLAQQGQDIMQPSQGGNRAAFPLYATPVPASRYNVKLGPVKMLFNASVNTGYNSNVNVSNDNPIGDLVFSPRIGMGVYWPITKLNKLRLNVSLGYDYYLNNPELGGQTLLVAPDTEFMFNIMVGDIVITLFDRPSITNNPVDNPSLSDAVNYTIANNTAGINLTWDLNDVLIGAGYSNYISYALNDDFDYLNRFSNQIFGNISMLVLPTLRVGMEASASTNTYLEGSNAGSNALNDSLNYTAGAFAEATLSRYLECSGGVGWQISDFNEGNNPLNTGNVSTPYFYFALENTLNRYFSHRLATGFESMPSSESNALGLFYARYSFNWVLIRNWSLGGAAFFENGTETDGPNSEDFSRLGGTIGLNYQLSQHWVLGVYGGFIGKRSTRSSYSYTQQTFGLNVTYNF